MHKPPPFSASLFHISMLALAVYASALTAQTPPSHAKRPLSAPQNTVDAAAETAAKNINKENINIENIESKTTPNAHGIPVKVGYIDIWPLAYTSAGQAMGSWNTAVTAAIDKLKRPAAFKEVPIKRMYSLVSRGELHVAMTVRNSGYVEDTVILGQLPLGYLKTRLFAIAPDAFNAFTSIFELKGETIIMIQGFSHAGLRRKIETEYPDINIVETTTHESGLAMLQAGRAKYLLGYNLPASSDWGGVNLAMLQNEIVQEIPVYYVVSTKAPNYIDLVKALEQQALTVQTKIQKLVNR